LIEQFSAAFLKTTMMKQDNKPITKKDLNEAVKTILDHTHKLINDLGKDLRSPHMQGNNTEQRALQEAR